MEKPGVESSTNMRIIHDLSYPSGESVNDYTNKTRIPPAEYHTPAAMARKITALRRRFPKTELQMMSGDVNGAFRNVPFHENDVHMFCARVPELDAIVIDMYQGFGWTGAPGFYGLAGSSINSLYNSMRPVWNGQPMAHQYPFDGTLWRDDHNSFKPNVGSRLAEVMQLSAMPW